MAKTEKPKTRYAHVRDPMIVGIIHEMFSFEDATQALAKIENLASRYTTSQHQIENDQTDYPSLILWIRNYEVTDEDKENGLMGNYACITYKEVKESKLGAVRYTLYAIKLPAERKLHPMKKQLKTRHPNWGHPVMQSIKERVAYTTPEEAQAQLDRLHADFPEVTVPNPGKLYTMLYQRRKNRSNIRKMVLETKLAEDGVSFVIDCYKNEYKQKKTQEVLVPTDAPIEQEPDEPMGKFTAKVALKRAKKQPKS